MYGSPHPKVRITSHQSPNTESNRRPSPYHGDALPTELLGRAMKTLHGRRPFAQIRYAAHPRACRAAGRGTPRSRREAVPPRLATGSQTGPESAAPDPDRRTGPSEEGRGRARGGHSGGRGTGTPAGTGRVPRRARRRAPWQTWRRHRDGHPGRHGRRHGIGHPGGHGGGRRGAPPTPYRLRQHPASGPVPARYRPRRRLVRHSCLTPVRLLRSSSKPGRTAPRLGSRCAILPPRPRPRSPLPRSHPLPREEPDVLRQPAARPPEGATTGTTTLLLCGARLTDGRTVDVRVSGGRIEAVGTPGSLGSHGARVDLGGYLLLPAPRNRTRTPTRRSVRRRPARSRTRPPTSSAAPPRRPCCNSATGRRPCAPT